MAKRTGRPRREQTATTATTTAPPRVALLLNLVTRRGRQQLHGIHRFAWPTKRWLMRVRVPEVEFLADAIEWKPEGIIAEVVRPQMVELLKDSGIPVVNVSSHLASHPFALVDCDHLAIGRLAAEHFLSKGFRNFGYLDAATFHNSQLRRDGFIQRLQQADREVSVLTLGRNDGAFRHWDRASAKLMKWLQSLPRPAAVFAHDDFYASLVSQACITAGLAVPEQVALLGVENDDSFWLQAHPPLSSIQTPDEQIGYHAARLLERLMAGEPAGDLADDSAGGPAGRASIPRRLIAPVGLLTRASSDILAINDPDVAMAVRYINTNANRPINVADVVAAVPLCRRVLERRFRQTLGRSILDELHRVRINRVKQLLATSSEPMPKIAELAGFYDAAHLWAVFRKATNMSPAAYRRQNLR